MTGVLATARFARPVPAAVEGIDPPPVEARRATRPATWAADAVEAPGPWFWLMSVHGGCGASTLAHQIPEAAECGRLWPNASAPEVWSPYVVLVARETREGLTSLHDLLRQSRTGLVETSPTVIGVVTVAASGQSSADLDREREVIASLAPARWRVPFLPALHTLRIADLPVLGAAEETAPSRRRFGLGSRLDVTTTVCPAIAEFAAAACTEIVNRHQLSEELS